MPCAPTKSGVGTAPRTAAYDGRMPRFASISLDCADPRELARFYVGLLGGQLLWSEDGSAGVRAPGLLMVMQRTADYRKPAWPGSSIVHLDLAADGSLDEAERRAVACGATMADVQPDARWRVLLDPAGHPFCITTVTPPPETLDSVYGHGYQ